MEKFWGIVLMEKLSEVSDWSWSLGVGGVELEKCFCSHLAVSDLCLIVHIMIPRGLFGTDVV